MTTYLPTDDRPQDRAQRLIPGAYDRTTLTHRQPGSMGGGAFGAGLPSGPSSMDAATITERELEGGGAVRERRRTVTQEPRRGPALANVEPNESQWTGRAWWLRWWSPAR